MTLPEVFGYIASGLVLATFSVRTMLPLRILGISSNIAFMTYAVLAGLLPVLILHAILLPLNIYRFVEMRRLIREIQHAGGGEHDLDALLPFMSSVTRPAGSTLFQKGDPADEMFVLTSGHIRLPEFDVEIGPGHTVGEIGVFSPGGRRMATAVCTEDCSLQRVTRERLRALVYQNPRIGFGLIEIITARLLEDVAILQQQRAAGTGAAR